MGQSPRSYTLSFVEISRPVPEKKISCSFYHIWAWRPSWSCDLDHLYKLSFPLPKDAPRSLALIGQAVSEEKIFEIVDDDEGRTPDHGHPISSPKLLYDCFFKNKAVQVKTVSVRYA